MPKFLEVAASRIRGINWDGVRDTPQPGCEVYDMTDLPMTRILDNTYDGIYSEHFIEHLYKYQGINFLKECLRILRPGGTLRTVWPSYDVVERLVSDEDLSNDDFVKHYYQFYILKHKFSPPGNEHRRIQEQVALGLLHQGGEHLYLWGKDELISTCDYLGFQAAREYEYQKSGLEYFNDIDTPGSIRSAHSSVVEAKKPLC